MQIDRLILGKILTLKMLGIYSIAFMFSDLPRQIVQTISKQVMYPIVSQQVNLPRHELREKILAKRWIILTALAILVTILVCFGDYLILVLYDERYNDAAWMLPILSLGIWPSVLTATIDRSLYVLGKPKYNTFGYILKFLYMIFLLPLSYSLMGILGVIIVISLNDLPVYLPVCYGLFKENLNCLKQDLWTTLVLIIMILAVSLIRWIINGDLFIKLIPLS